MLHGEADSRWNILIALYITGFRVNFRDRDLLIDPWEVRRSSPSPMAKRLNGIALTALADASISLLAVTRVAYAH